MKYLSQDGVKYLWSKIKNVFIKKTDALTFEEIQASTDLTGKVTSAGVQKDWILYSYLRTTNFATDNNVKRTITVKHSRWADRLSLLVFGDGNGYPWIGILMVQVSGNNKFAELYSLRDQAFFWRTDISEDETTGVATIPFSAPHSWEKISILGCADVISISSK